MAVVISWPVAAYVFLVLAVIFALMFLITFSSRFVRMALPFDGESMNEEPTLNTRGPERLSRLGPGIGRGDPDRTTGKPPR